jgi:hypothetical protein
MDTRRISSDIKKIFSIMVTRGYLSGTRWVSQEKLLQQFLCQVKWGGIPKIASPRPENIKQAKRNECSQYKSTAAIFSSSLPICPVYFHPVMPRHVWMGQMGRLKEKIAAVLLY